MGCRRRTVTLVLLAASLVTGCAKKPAEPQTGAIKVAAAADLAFAFREIAAEYQKRTGHSVTFSFGSTGLLAKQIHEGAPFDVFAAANVSFVDDVIRSGNCFADSKASYALGRIVVWWRKGADIVAPAALADLADARFKKIAIANPEHAPYGRAAQEALTKAGVWEQVKPKLVFGENVQQTLQFAQSGNVDAAIVALSLATVTENGESLAIDPASISPIDQALVVCKGRAQPDAARAFTAFIASEQGRTIMGRYGFLLPD